MVDQEEREHGSGGEKRGVEGWGGSDVGEDMGCREEGDRRRKGV